MRTEYLFVYGTLRKQISSQLQRNFLKNCRYVSKGYIQAKLYEVKNYPGALVSENAKDKVYGEIYRITRTWHVMHRLDIYEECSDFFPEPHEYQRAQLSVVRVGRLKAVRAWVYLYNWKITGLLRIKPGDYFNYRKLSNRRR